MAKFEEQNCQKEDAANERNNRAFVKVKGYAQEVVLKEAKAVKMSELLEKDINLLTAEGINALNYRSSKLKSRLMLCLSFQQPLDKKQSETVYSAHVTTCEVVETVMNSNTGEYADEEGRDEEVASDISEDDNKFIQVYHTAKAIRGLVSDMKPVMKWPPTAEDLDCENAIVPDLVYNLFAWIFFL